MFCCTEGDLLQTDPVQTGQTGLTEQKGVVTDVYGREYPSLDPKVIYCGPGWGRKMCHFLHNYDGTSWEYEGSRISFSNFTSNPIFMTFSNLDDFSPNSQGWKLGETTYGNVRWNIEIKRDEEDILWIAYEYYGSGEVIEKSITYKFKVIDNVLHISSTEGQSFVFYPF